MLSYVILASVVAVCSTASFPVNISTVQIVQPQRYIRCPADISVTCDIQLTVSYMQTLTAYNVQDDDTRSDGGYQVRVRDNGDLEVYPEASARMPTTQLFQPIIADGTTQRNLVVINDQLPGPTLIGYNGQRVRITVTNTLGSEAITLHWHGQHVNGSSGSNQFSDGVPYVTQCPIFPGNSFVYDYVFYPGGTYWYHSHMFDQRSNGAYGALIVLDAPETGAPIDMPEEHTISLFEWFPVSSNNYIESPFTYPDLAFPSTLYQGINTYDGGSASGFQFYAGFMNSNGWRFAPGVDNCTRSATDNPYPQECIGPLAPYPLPAFNVDSDNSYRFRLIGSQVTYAYRFSIAGHRLRVVATDGIDATIPQNGGYVDFIIIHVGERYDFVIDTDKTPGNYLVVFETLEEPSLLRQNCYCVKAHRGYAVLHYNEAATAADDVDPPSFVDSYDPLMRCNSTNQCYALNCPFEAFPSDLSITCIDVQEMQLTSPEAVPDVDVTPSVFLNFGFHNGPAINNRNFVLPPAPPLSEPYVSESEADFCEYATIQESITTPGPPGSPTAAPDPPINTDIPEMCTHTYTVPDDVEAVEMVYTNVASQEAHPVHLHGHHYFVMEIGYPEYNTDGTFKKRSQALDCSADNGTCVIGVRWSPGYPSNVSCMVNGTCPLKDTVIVPYGGWVRVRFPRDNWGWWIMHCHIEPHLLGGMAMVVNETSVPGTFPVPIGFPSCGNFYNNETASPTLSPPITGGQITPEQSIIFRNATIALAIILILLLIAVVMLIVVLVYFYKTHSKPKVVQEPSHGMEMKRTEATVEVEISTT